jgi:putative endonuclease
MQKSSEYRKDLGRWGETYACDYLQKKGYQLISKNYYSRYGEIDLIMRVEDTLVAVEVKTRRSNEFGYGEDSITNKKLKTIYMTMTSFLMEHPKLPENWQLDVVVVEPVRDLPTIIHHYENVSFEGIS